MLSQDTTTQSLQIQIWPIGRFVPYARNPRKNDGAVDRMCASIREFGFKNPRARAQRRFSCRWPLAAEGRAEARLLAGW